jgi:hypothetical protein
MISFSTTKPKTLLAAIKSAIDKGHITTWSYDSDGDFTHSTNQWARKAWMRPRIAADEALRFNIVFPRDEIADREIYAIYHGRFGEMMLAHFDSEFSRISATAQLVSGDLG